MKMKTGQIKSESKLYRLQLMSAKGRERETSKS